MKSLNSYWSAVAKCSFNIIVYVKKRPQFFACFQVFLFSAHLYKRVTWCYLNSGLDRNLKELFIIYLDYFTTLINLNELGQRFYSYCTTITINIFCCLNLFSLYRC